MRPPPWKSAGATSTRDAAPAPAPSKPHLPDPKHARCETCGARPGYPCDQSKQRGSMDGYHVARVRAACGEPKPKPNELDEYNRIITQRHKGHR